MNLTDPIGDMLTRIRNGNMARAEVVEIPYSKLKDVLVRLLKREGFIADFTAEGGDTSKKLRVYLKYVNGREPVIRGLRRVSKPGLRKYVAAGELKAVKRGTGVAILSTSRGVLTDDDARQQKVGGEWLCTIW